MLCPECGKEVGDRTRICDECDAAEKAEKEREEEAANPQRGSDPDGASDLDADSEATGPGNLPAIKLKGTGKKPLPPEARTAESSGGGKKVVVFLVAALAFGVIGYMTVRSLAGGSSGTAAGSASSSASSKIASLPEASASPIASIAPASSPVPASTTAAAAGPGTQPVAAPSGAALPGSSAQPIDTAAAEVNLTNLNWKESIALYDKGKNELSIALYGAPLTPEEKSAIRQAGGFPVKSPRFIESFVLEPDATAFNNGAVKSARVLYSGAETNHAAVGFSYVVNHKEVAVASLLTGGLSEGGTVSAGSKQSADKVLDDGRKLRISWDLIMKAPIVAVVTTDPSAATGGSGSVTGAMPAAGETPGPVSSSGENSPTNPDAATSTEEGSSSSFDNGPPPKIPEGSFGSISAEDYEMAIKDKFAIYYPETGSVSIGLYGQELSEDDRAELKRKKIVTAFVNGKRASMVLTLDFSKKEGSASRQDLVGFTAYFYRDSSGLFFFPGSYDSRSVHRSPKDFQKYEFSTLSGPLADGGTLVLRTFGIAEKEQPKARPQDSPRSPPQFQWNLSFQVPLVAAR